MKVRLIFLFLDCPPETNNFLIEEPSKVNIKNSKYEDENNYLILYHLLANLKTDSLSNNII